MSNPKNMNSYYFTSGGKRLRDEQSKFFVEFFDKDENLNHKINFFTNHKHHLPTTFIHVDVGDQNSNVDDGDQNSKKEDQNSKKDITGRPPPKRTLKKHLELLKKDNILPVMVFQHDNGVHYVPEEVRMIIKAIISAVIYVHTRKGALKGLLTWENFVIYDHCLALQDLSFRKKSSKTIVNDFIYVHLFIKENIFGPDLMKTIPKDMQDLLNVLKRYEDSKKDLVAYHFATMSHSERICFMKNCWEKNNEMEVKSFAKAITKIKSMPTPNEGEEEEKMWWECMDNCKLWQLKLCYKNGEEMTTYNKSTTYESNMSGIRCCRNMASHLREINTRPQLGEMEIDIMVSSVFTPMLLQLAGELQKLKKLSKVITWMDGS